MPDWLFHWTHDEVFKEVLKVSIPALGSILAALIAWYGIRRTAKVTQEALENSKEATPPELLRLEKWSAILTDSKNYPKKIKHELDVDTIQSTYNDILKRATLENRAKNLGIVRAEVLNMLLMQSTLSSRGIFPKNLKWKNYFSPLLISAYICLGHIFIAFIIFSFLKNEFYFGDIIVIIIYLVCVFIIIMMFYLNYIDKQEKNIIFRNAYKSLSDIFVLGNLDLKETLNEKKQREKFENRKKIFSFYKLWKDNIKDKHPDWGSWNYGLNIDWNNDPDVYPIEYYI